MNQPACLDFFDCAAFVIRTSFLAMCATFVIGVAVVTTRTAWQDWRRRRAIKKAWKR